LYLFIQTKETKWKTNKGSASLITREPKTFYYYCYYFKCSLNFILA
jgi:hypothetical protein